MWKGLFDSDNNVCITVKGNLFPDTFPPCSQCFSFFKKSDILAWLKLMQKLPAVSTEWTSPCPGSGEELASAFRLKFKSS